MSIVKSIARKLIFPVVTAVGAEKLLSRSTNYKKLIIMYHGVVKEVDFKFSVNHLHISDFEKQIKYLKENFEIVSLQEIFKNNSGNSKKIAITFDDGYENNFTNAFPILKKYSAPATIFIVAKILEDPNYITWYDKIDSIKNNINISLFKSQAFEFNSVQKQVFDKINSIDDLKSFFKILDHDQKDSILKYLVEASGKSNISRPEFTRMLTKGQLLEMIGSGLIEIGSHTVYHSNLSDITLDQAERELSDSKQLIESQLNYKVQSLAFPDGSYNESIKKLALKCGYKFLLAVNYKLGSDQKDDNIRPRFCISNTTTTESNVIQIHSSFKNLGF